MKNLFKAFALSAVLLSGIASIGSADSMKSGKAAKTMSCPACHMPMPTVKSAMMCVPVKIKGVTYFCCKDCPAGKAHMKPKMKTMMKSKSTM